MKLFTIGFTKTSAEHFFTRLDGASVRSLVDVRLHNVSQLAGFAKRDDLEFFTKKLLHVPYVHRPELAPTEEMLAAHRKARGAWDEYAKRFLDLMASRRIEDSLSPSDLDGACLLCSEDGAHRCHRRLVAEYLTDKWGDVELVHL